MKYPLGFLIEAVYSVLVLKNVCFNKYSCVTVSPPILKVCYVKVLKQNTLNQFPICFQVAHLLLDQYVSITHGCTIHYMYYV